MKAVIVTKVRLHIAVVFAIQIVKLPTCVADDTSITLVEDANGSYLQGVNSRWLAGQVNVDWEST